MVLESKGSLGAFCSTEAERQTPQRCTSHLQPLAAPGPPARGTPWGWGHRGFGDTAGLRGAAQRAAGSRWRSGHGAEERSGGELRSQRAPGAPRGRAGHPGAGGGSRRGAPPGLPEGSGAGGGRAVRRGGGGGPAALGAAGAGPRGCGCHFSAAARSLPPFSRRRRPRPRRRAEPAAPAPAAPPMQPRGAPPAHAQPRGRLPA